MTDHFLLGLVMNRSCMLGNVDCVKKVQIKTIIDYECVKTELAGCDREGIFSEEDVNLRYNNFTKVITEYRYFKPK